ncbi:MAG: right-handed parallel beta-helix repeat-containing protein [Candidatus Zixiibacteriota bacterium]|nr:MAG: right-handed parallel beta-helix repeat-containing protein [candidate division Zixibacteria bacterium]
MLIRRILSLSIIALAYQYASATIIHIPADYSTIQQGINASAEGDTVLVQPGTYVENLTITDREIVLGSLFLTTGDTSYIPVTIIDGDSAGNVIGITNGGPTTTVIGFTIQNGYSYGFHTGAGIFCYGNSIISNNIIKDNHFLALNDYKGGGGIACYGSTAVISNNIIINNVVTDSGNYYGYGGGIFCFLHSSVIINNLIANNSASWGGGIGLYSSNPIIKNNIIWQNISDPCWGAGIFCRWQSNASIINNVIYENSPYDGIALDYSDPILINNIIRNNGDVDLYFYSQGAPTVSYCNLRGGWQGVGNIDIDPLFRDPTGGDFHLMATYCGDTLDSPCINAGDPNILDSLLDCSWGLAGLRSDMGAYGGGDSLITGIFDEYIPPPRGFLLSQNYPNPFNAKTAIRYSLPYESEISLSIYNLLGRKIETLFEGVQNPGEHDLTWNASHLPSGIYFARLETRCSTKNIKMVLLK